MQKNFKGKYMDNKVDIKEKYIYNLDNKLLNILLSDHSSSKNIIWATDNYKVLGKGYNPNDHISIRSITGKNGMVIKPRVEKSQKEQLLRIKDKAEVFTPSWICNSQNNLIDNAWFERENVFNVEKNNIWIVNKQPITFPKGKTWQDYVKEPRLEISCGEAPYLCSRYDTVTGEWIEVGNRIGLLDRKLRVINENVKNADEWFKWTLIAYKSIYGFEWQGDSLLIARENLLFTFIDYYIERFNNYPSNQKMAEVAKILSWNVWQMDGLKYVIPNSCDAFLEDGQECLGCKKNTCNYHSGIYCKIMNWEKKRSIKFVSLLNKK